MTARTGTPPQFTGRAGVARVDITPPLGAPLIGFAGRDVANDIADPLTATALFLDSAATGGGAVAVVTCDLEGIDACWTDEVQQAARAATGIEDLHVLVSCSHTHYAPAGPTMDHEGELEHPVSVAYTALLVHQLTGVVGLAVARARPAALRVSVGACSAGVNRRERRDDGTIVLGQNPAGPCDERVALVVVEDDAGAPIASVANFACHAVAHGGDLDYRAISADFIAPLRDTVERYTAAPLLFLQGAAGDINPRTMGGEPLAPLDTGLPVAAEVMRLWNRRSTSALQDVDVRVEARTYRYDPLLPPTVDDARAALALQDSRLKELLRSRDPDPSALDWSRLLVQRAADALEVLEGRAAAEPVAAQQYGVRLTAGVAISAVPAELFNELGVAIAAASPFEVTLIAAYTNGLIGYVPTRAAYAEGGYEVTHGAFVSAGEGERMVSHATELLDAVGATAAGQN